MNRTQILATIAGMTALIVLLDLRTSAELSLPVLFTFPLILCARRRSKWILWTTAGLATAASVASVIWVFHRVALVNSWVAWANRGLLVASLLTLTALIHFWIRERRANSQIVGLVFGPNSPDLPADAATATVQYCSLFLLGIRGTYRERPSDR